MTEITYRPAMDADGPSLIELIDKCYAEYDGCILDVDGEEPQLRRIASYFSGKQGEFWVAEQAGRIVGSIGYVQEGDQAEIKHLYVDGTIRRQGLASRLCSLVENAASKRQLSAIILWTDTRFTNAHRLYEKRGFVKGGMTRDLDDLSKTTEYYYQRTLRTS